MSFLLVPWFTLDLKIKITFVVIDKLILIDWFTAEFVAEEGEEHGEVEGSGGFCQHFFQCLVVGCASCQMIYTCIVNCCTKISNAFSLMNKLLHKVFDTLSVKFDRILELLLQLLILTSITVLCPPS